MSREPPHSREQRLALKLAVVTGVLMVILAVLGLVVMPSDATALEYVLRIVTALCGGLLAFGSWWRLRGPGRR